MTTRTQTRGFLFADLRGYSQFTDRHGDAAARELIARYRALVRGVIAEHDGAPVVHELMTYMQERRDNEARWRAGLEETDLPMTFVWGDLDPISGAHMVERVEERLPKADVRRMTDVGHWPPLEAPADVAAAVTDSL